MKHPNYIKYFRELAGLEPHHVYKALGWGQSRYSHYETGQRKLQFEDAQVIADIIGCATDSLFTGKQAPKAAIKCARYRSLQNALIKLVFSEFSENVQMRYMNLLDSEIDELSRDETGELLLGFVKGLKATATKE